MKKKINELSSDIFGLWDDVYIEEDFESLQSLINEINSLDDESYFFVMQSTLRERKKVK